MLADVQNVSGFTKCWRLPKYWRMYKILAPGRNIGGRQNLGGRWNLRAWWNISGSGKSWRSAYCLGSAESPTADFLLDWLKSSHSDPRSCVASLSCRPQVRTQPRLLCFYGRSLSCTVPAACTGPTCQNIRGSQNYWRVLVTNCTHVHVVFPSISLSYISVLLLKLSIWKKFHRNETATLGAFWQCTVRNIDFLVVVRSFSMSYEYFIFLKLCSRTSILYFNFVLFCFKISLNLWIYGDCTVQKWE